MDQDTKEQTAPDLDNLERSAGGKDQNTANTAKLADKEKSAGETTPSDDLNFTGGAGSGKKRGFWNRKRAAISGGIVGTILGVFGLGSYLTGPLELLHFGELIHTPHFSANENFLDSRLGRFIVYARDGSVGNTRLSFIERKLNKQTTAQMEKMGIKPVTQGVDYLKAWQFDSSVKGSPIENKSPAEISKWAQETLGLKEADINIDGGKVTVTADSFTKQTKTTYNLMRAQGYSKVSSAMRTRVLGKFFDFTFHPLTKIDQKVNTTIAESYKAWKEKRSAAIKEGTTLADADTIRVSTVDENGNAIEGQTGETSTSRSKLTSSIKDFLSTPSGKTTTAVTAGGLAIAGAVCTIKSIADGTAEAKFENNVIPLIRISMEIQAAKSQIESGEDFNDLSLDFLMQQLYTRDPETGKIVDSWYDGESIAANDGRTGGIATPLSVIQAANFEIPAALSWTQGSPILDGLCSPIGIGIQVVGGVASLALGGGFISGALQLIAGAITGPIIENYIVDQLSGDAITEATGAALGSQADFGSLFAANQLNLNTGGTVLSGTQVAELNAQTAEYEKETFQEKSLVARMFDVKDRYSFASQVIDSKFFDAQNTLATIRTNLINPIDSLSSVFSNIFASQNVFAASNFDYGVPILGFSLADQNNPLIASPQLNADAVGELLDSAQGQTYVDRAKSCLGVDIVNTSEGWNAVPTSSDAFQQVFEKQGMDGDCTKSSTEDPNWLRVRAFIADMSAIEAWACTEGDDTSCINSGYGSNISTTATTTASTTSGLDFTELQQDSSNVACAEGTTDLGIESGYAEGKLVKIRLCAIPGFKSNAAESKSTSTYYVEGSNGNVIVNARVSASWLALYEKAKSEGQTLSATSGWRSNAHQAYLKATLGDQAAPAGYSNHQMGLAIDFSNVGGGYKSSATCADRNRATWSATWNWLNKNAVDFGFRQYAKEAWHWDPDTASYNCVGDG